MVKEMNGEMMSIEYSDKKFEDSMKMEIIMKNTINNFIRSFPSGTSITSKNYNVVNCYNTGIQIAAINIQKQDRYYIISREFFRNGPYRLKPEWLLKKDSDYRDYKKTLILFIDSTFNIKVYSPKDNYNKMLKVNSKHKNENVYIIGNINITAPILYFEYCNEIKPNSEHLNKIDGCPVGKYFYRSAKEFDYKCNCSMIYGTDNCKVIKSSIIFNYY